MNLLFDLDGTLTDPYLGITNCIVYALEGLDRDAPPREGLSWCIGPPLKESFKRLLGIEDDELASDAAASDAVALNALVEKALALYRVRFASVGLYENVVFDGIPDVLGRLQQNGHALYVATSKPTVFAARIIDHFGMGRYFRAVYGSELDGTHSDKVGLIAHIIEHEGIAVSQTVMIGDRKHDMIGASGNGIPGYGVLWGYGSKGELEMAGSEGCVATPDDLLTLFCG